jgi:hypothetical protein
MMGRKSDALAMSLMDEIGEVPEDMIQRSAQRMAEGGAESDSEVTDFPFPEEIPPASLPWTPVEVATLLAADTSSPEAKPTLEAFAATRDPMHETIETEVASQRVPNDRLDIDGAQRTRSPFPNGAAEAARLSTVRDYHKHIAPDDSLYFVMTFIERAGQHITSEMRDQLRFARDDVVNAINDATERLKAASAQLEAAQASIEASAQQVGGRLRATVAQVINELARDREAVVPIVKERFVEELAGEGGELEEIKRLVRSMVPEEVRLAIKGAVGTESSVLKDAMGEASKALKVSAAAAKARAKNGWLKNAADDMKSLADERRYVVVGAVTAAVLFSGYLLTRIVTGIFH